LQRKIIMSYLRVFAPSDSRARSAFTYRLTPVVLSAFIDRKAPKGKFESPWSLHIGIFWKIHFINPPEAQDQVVDLLIYGRKITMPRYQIPPFGSTGKSNRSCHAHNLRKFPRNCMNGLHIETLWVYKY